MYCLGYSGFTRDSHLAEGILSPFAKTNQDFNTIFEFHEGEVPFSFFPLGYFGHDASAALFLDGKVIACASEERFTRLKYSLNLTGNTLLPKMLSSTVLIMLELLLKMLIRLHTIAVLINRLLKKIRTFKTFHFYQ